MVVSICVCSLQRLSQISQNAKIINVCAKNLSVVYANEERRETFVSLRVSLNEADRRRLENKTPSGP